MMHWVFSSCFYISNYSLLVLMMMKITGHSMGGSMCMLFAATHPEMVRRLIMIDTFKPMSRELNNMVAMTRLSGR